MSWPWPRRPTTRPAFPPLKPVTDDTPTGTLLEHLNEPEPKCRCGHHKSSHCHGFRNLTCLWCACRQYEHKELP